MDPPTRFFKPYIPDRCSEQLLILPASFLQGGQYWSRKIPRQVTLRRSRGCSSRLWSIEVVETDNGSSVYFRRGWGRFVSENAIELGDFLVFEYDGHSNFDVILLGSSGCEKLGEADFYGAPGGGEGSYHTTDWDEEDDDLEAVVEDGKQWDEEDDDLEAVVEDGKQWDEEDDLEAVVEDGKQWDDEEGDLEAVVGDVDKQKDDEGDGDASRNKQRRYERQCDVPMTDEIQSMLPLGSPFFVAKKSNKRPGELLIPFDVRHNFGINFGDSVNLHDQRERKWRARVNKWKDGLVMVTRPWRSFCKYNGVLNHDVLIFQLFLGEGNICQDIKVQVIRQ